jgi:hypothetical protein
MVHLSEILAGEARLPDGDIFCDGIPLARYGGGRLVAIACNHQCHGVRDQQKEFAERLSRWLPPKQQECAEADCPKCGGALWLNAGTDEYENTVMVSLAMGVFRGVYFPPRRK